MMKLLIWLFIGAVCLVLGGFNCEWIQGRTGFSITHAQCWELGALTWTFLFSFWFYITFPFTGKTGFDKSVAAGAILGVGAFTVFALATLFGWWGWDKPYHIWAVFGIGFVFLVIDAALSNNLRQPNQRRAFQESLWYVDVPINSGLAVLVAYQHWHGHAEHIEIFMSGAIAFQFISSNVIFALIQAGVFRSIYTESLWPR